MGTAQVGAGQVGATE